MLQVDLIEEFEKRGPWITRFRIGDRDYGGTFDAGSDARINQFFEAFPDAHTILELGSLEGGHTFALAKRATAKRVVGIEGRHVNVARAQFVQQYLGITNVSFFVDNLETTNLASYGIFDAVFCSGLLYHLPTPWTLIEQISRVSQNLFLSTHYAKLGQENVAHNGIQGMMYNEIGLADPLSGLSTQSFWPTFAGLIYMLKEYGFDNIDILHDNQEHPHGAIVNLSATASR